MLTHSDGGGRTGIYIAVDAVLEQLESQRNADIFSCVIYLRSCRQNLVKTLVRFADLHASKHVSMKSLCRH